MKLQGKLTVLLIAVGLIPLAVTGVIAHRQSSAALSEGAGTATEEIAFNASDKLDRNLFERYGDAQMFASSSAAQSMDPRRLREWMNRTVKTYSPAYDLIVVADLSGRIVATNSIDPAGKPLDAGALRGRSVRGERWFTAAVSGRVLPGRTFVEDAGRDPLVSAVYGAGAQAISLRFTAPIRDASGRIVGVWSNRFNWDVAREILGTQRERAGPRRQAGHGRSPAQRPTPGAGLQGAGRHPAPHARSG
jgi:hypothetical protein